MENRVIKFRAWDGNKMIYQFHITSRGIAWRSNDNADENYTEAIDFPLMQYIGLNAKSGAEIYHGDIVSVRGTKEVGVYNTKVVYLKSGFVLEKNHTYFKDDCALTCVIDVIGNVYQHPDLINQ